MTPLMMNFFLTNTQLFTSLDVNWWTRVMWIYCWDVSISCLAPIHCRGPIDVMLHFSKGVPDKLIYIMSRGLLIISGRYAKNILSIIALNNIAISNNNIYLSPTSTTSRPRRDNIADMHHKHTPCSVRS